MKQNVNYITHHKGVNIRLSELDFNSTHIALYNALFLIWNMAGFESELSISRNELMKLSKIGSTHTYLKCLKDLHKEKIIIYKPSHNPLKGSIVNLCRFDTSKEQVVHKQGTSSGTSTAPLPKRNKLSKPIKPKKQREEKNTPPSFQEFSDYAFDQEEKLNITVDQVLLKAKYLSWVENGWKTGKDKKIKNWKSTLLNTLPFLEKEKGSAQKEKKLNVTQRVFGEYYEEATELILNGSHTPEYKKISGE